MTSFSKGAFMRRDGAVNRERILEAAEAVFGSQGSAGSTEEVARLAGVGVATVFRHFPTKADLLAATAVRHLDAMSAQARAFAEGGDSAKRLEAVMRMLIATGPTKATLLHTVLEGGGELPPQAAATVKDVRATVGEILREAQRAQEIRSDVTVEDVFTHARALAHIATADNGDTIARALSVVIAGMTVR
jgi:AcrR family transcriptional regulator